MEHDIDLDVYTFYTDLAFESLKYNNIKTNEKKYNKYKDIIVTTVDIDENTSKIINKKKGKYTTIEFNDVTDSNNQKKLIDVLSIELKKYIDVKKDELVLIVGLGNELSTPDSLGPKCIDNMVVTNHIFNLELLDNHYYRTAVLKPSVLGKTGIETSKIIKSICKEIKPKLVILIDSLASGSLDRLNKTIQITDTGINPGSGIGNNRKEINEEVLHTKVLALGVPTVVSALNILHDTLEYTKSNIDIKSILNKVLKIDKFNLVVTPTEIDYVIECLSNVISSSINNIFYE